VGEIGAWEWLATEPACGGLHPPGTRHLRSAPLHPKVTPA